MRNSAAAAAAMIPVKKEHIVIDLDNEDEEYMMDAAQIDTSTDSDKTNPSNMGQTLCTDTKADPHYMKLLDSFREDGTSRLGDNPLNSIRYEADNGGYDKRDFKRSGGAGNRRRDADCRRKIPVNVESKPHRVEASRKKTRKGESLVRKKSVKAILTTTRKKKDSEGEIVFDENYRSYLRWLVEKSENPTTSNPIIQVKSEELADSDIIAVEDRPFLDDEDSPFVPSKSDQVVDLEDRSSDHQRNSWFRKEIMNLLKQPYNKKEFKELKHEVSVRRDLTRCRQLLNGGELYVKTDQKTPSYLHKYPDFKRKFRNSLREKDRGGALNLLRGFIFYLQKVSRDDAFKPWLDRECLKITCF